MRVLMMYSAFTYMYLVCYCIYIIFHLYISFPPPLPFVGLHHTHSCQGMWAISISNMYIIQLSMLC